MLLVGGGALAAIGLGIFLYSTIEFANNLMNDNRYRIGPGESQSITQFIGNVSEGAYIVALQETFIQLNLSITNPSNMTIVERQVSLSPNDAPIFERFPVDESGDYVLTLANPSADAAVDISAVLGDNESILETGFSFASLALTFVSMFVTGIAVAIAGAVITVLDRRRISKMKQFGDTSDLV